MQRKNRTSKKAKTTYELDDIHVPVEYVVSFEVGLNPYQPSDGIGVVATAIVTAESMYLLARVADVRNESSVVFTKDGNPFLKLTKSFLISETKSFRFPGLFEVKLFGVDWAGYGVFEVDTPLPEVSMWGNHE